MPRSTRTRSLIVGATTVALLGSLAGAGGARAASPTATPKAAAPCVVDSPAFRKDTEQVVYEVSFGTPSATVLRPGGLGYVPTALAYDRRYSEGAGFGSFYAVSPKGVVNYVRVNSTARPNGSVAYSYSQQRIRSGWQGVRQLAEGYDRLFALSGGTLVRYAKQWDPDYELGKRTVIDGSFADVRTMAYARGEERPSGADLDVLMATLSSGALVEYSITQSGRVARVTTLAATGFGSYASLSLGPCEIEGARGLLGITTAGTAYAFFDPDEADGSARDMVRVKVATGWRATSYSS